MSLLAEISKEALVAIGVLVLTYSPLIFIYLLPGIIALNRGRKNSGAIFLFNLLLGWSLIGWGIALVWAIKEPTSFTPPDNIYTLWKDNLPWWSNVWVAWDESVEIFYNGLFWGIVAGITYYFFGVDGWAGFVVTITGLIAVYGIFIVIPFAFIKISLFGMGGGIPCKMCKKSLSINHPTTMKKCTACGAVYEIRWESE